MASIDSDSFIDDLRDESDFKGISFSKCKRSDVKNVLLLNISKGNIESACHWCAELICAGHFMDIWEIILFYLGKKIHLGNPKLVLYLESRYIIFESILEKKNYTSVIQLRNNATIRKLFAEIISILSQSKTKHSFETIKIDSADDFDVSYISEHLKAPTTEYLKPIIKEGDPKGFFIAVNEFAYSITSHNMVGACFWIEWLIEFESHCKKKKDKQQCETRAYPVEAMFRRDPIWIIWDAILYYGKQKSGFIQKTLVSLSNLFCIKYTTGCCKKRRYLLYFAVGLLIENVEINVDLATDKKIIQSVMSQIDNVYRQIKINEESAKMDYLYLNASPPENNKENTYRKLEIMNSYFNL